jgi:hypothetical protein
MQMEFLAAISIQLKLAKILVLTINCNIEKACSARSKKCQLLLLEQGYSTNPFYGILN